MSKTTPESASIDSDVDAFRQRMIDNLWHTHGQAIQTADRHDAYMTLCYTVRDHLIDRWRKTVEAQYSSNPKFVCYLSAEYLLGKQLPQNLLYTGTTEVARQALTPYGLDLDDLMQFDVEPGLGNGGLGRLAACFLDSLATLDMPAIGYGIRYEFGIFRQTFRDGWQVEQPDEWLLHGNPWEFPQPADMVEVGFGGHVQPYTDNEGHERRRWICKEKVLGEPCTTLVPGYGTQTVNILRLWRARATEEFDFRLFDEGDYARAMEQKIYSENISKVLYPNDGTPEGRQLRLRQQYFFVSCSLRDIIRLYRLKNASWDQFSDKAAIQLNDTHPVVAIPELMRLLLDEHLLEWDQAWEITRKTFAYTCHTLLPEALETWPLELFGSLLPRHLEIIYEINHRFLSQVRQRFPGDEGRVRRMSIIGEGPPRQIRMANLASVGSHAINGVAELQSRLLRERTLRDFADLWPDKFQNKTNGVTPRRFLRMANPQLSELIDATIGEGWLRDLEQLKGIEPMADSADFRAQWRVIKQANKHRLSEVLQTTTGFSADPDSIFDVMVKRLHEYKRQLLKALHIITLFHRIKSNLGADVPPQTFIFGAKAAPGYWMAKLIIKLINSLAETINRDPDVRDQLRVLFVPNFNVSLAERIYPAADLSEQISMAGKEASGTGNMKFALNGAVTVGTLDGANIEIRERVGEDNFFLFGLTADEVLDLKERGYRPRNYVESDPELSQVIHLIADGRFSGGDRELFQPIVDSLLDHDEYLVLADYRAYVDCCERACQAYLDPDRWTRMSILNTARCGFFSSDRVIGQYCEDIWNLKPVIPK
ncbi:glycogen/starch/alpha-glucan phosphorylase [Roseiconus nitratireducens]|uniref:Alpha-1,4 glucan phosphorylase n=1 Tax=Roseiconus nitratireducens TaxID=2605748 RepID=A0A5M6D2Y8_9BACT|nr:glycogen/starch/alpha-glucan phosphorylase [Roseiconus nitratireducens]KAA5541858.1 glycogen/starch/alpha-glucan phosphorylase [Roseiconus nitratireducens]